ncbi:MAG: Zn-dependent hydrolase [Bacteroidales bacterium]|nr:Zn-dependent hydrolase [Bacteroidales bacterium]
MQKKIIVIGLIISSLLFVQCIQHTDKSEQPKSKIERLLSNYADVKLESDLDKLTPNQMAMIPILIEAAEVIDELYWLQTCKDKDEIFNSISNDKIKKYFKINYGPWDKLSGMKTFVKGIDERPLGANFYPENMSYQEFEELDDMDKYSSYTLIRRNEIGKLKIIPYHKAYNEKLVKVADLLNKAAKLTDDKGFKKYLQLRAKALLNDKFFDSDVAWMQMKNNTLDFLVGPIEDAEDRLFFAKTAYQAMLLVKKDKLSKDLEKYTLLAPYIQKNLPVDDKYKKEIPGNLSDIVVYDVLYCSGSWNSASKRIALTLPIDGHVQLKVGSRKLQFKNVIEAKFEKILMPIGNLLIDDSQIKHVTSKAFFQNTMFYEVGSTLGLRNTINNKGSVRKALKEYNNVIAECKNDILSLLFITKLHEMGEMKDEDLMDNYVTYMADVFRSVRFGISNDQGVANMIRFYYFEEKDAFRRNERTGKYVIDFDKMKEAMMDLSKEVLMIQGDGDYDKAKKLVNDKGYIRDKLLHDLYRLQKESIPKDVVFEQGLEKLE